MRRKYLLLITLVLAGCGNSNNSSTSSQINSCSSKSSLSSLSTTTSNKDEMITKDFVFNKLNATINNSYNLSYSYEGIQYIDTFVPDSYYYNEMNSMGVLLANLYGNETFAYDFSVYGDMVEIKNQAYGINGTQGQESLSYASLGLNDYSNLLEHLEVTDEGIKLEERSYVNMLTYAINDSNSFEYIIFNKIGDNLTFDFYYDDQVYDGYSYVLKDIGNASNAVIDNYLKNLVKYENNGTNALETLSAPKTNIAGSIKYIGLMGNQDWEEISNTKIVAGDTINYQLSSKSNGVQYKQYFMEDSDNNIYKLGLNGQNESTKSITELSTEELYPNNLEFLNYCFSVGDNKYTYLGSNSNKVISYLLPNMSSIITDAWVTQIHFIIIENRITEFLFATDFYSLENNYGYFVGSFSVFDDGYITPLSPIEPDSEENVINELFNKLTKNDANYTLESNSYNVIDGELILMNEKHIINYVDNVYFDGNYRVNGDNSLTLQFANGYTFYNDKVYSYRYDAITKEVDNVRETAFKNIGEAIFSLKAEVIDSEEKNLFYINENVTDIKDNVGMLEQTGLIDPLTVRFHLNDQLDSIEKITYKYGNAYTNAYVEALISYGNASIDDTILEEIQNKLPKESEVEEFYMKDSDDDTVLEIYGYLKDEYLGSKADDIPYIPGIENCIDVIWLNDYPEGYQYLISDAPNDYLNKFKEALVSIYGYAKADENEFVNNQTGLKIEIKEDSGYQQIYILSI